ncbi:hypothetical protein BH11ACT4_BH11ACT4_06470 [soil metagenome]
MRILVYGAGVLGSINAARLFQAGHDVSLVARGARLAALRANGVMLAEGDSPVVEAVAVPIVEGPSGDYDLIVLLVRSHQVAAVLESIKGTRGDVLFLANWAAGPDPLGAVIGPERVILGFPNTGGIMDGDVVRYRRTTALTRRFPMSIGEPDGTVTPRLDRVLAAFRSTGYAAKAEPRMDAWLKTHAAFEVRSAWPSTRRADPKHSPRTPTRSGA